MRGRTDERRRAAQDRRRARARSAVAGQEGTGLAADQARAAEGRLQGRAQGRLQTSAQSSVGQAIRRTACSSEQRCGQRLGPSRVEGARRRGRWRSGGRNARGAANLSSPATGLARPLRRHELVEACLDGCAQTRALQGSGGLRSGAGPAVRVALVGSGVSADRPGACRRRAAALSSGGCRSRPSHQAAGVRRGAHAVGGATSGSTKTAAEGNGAGVRMEDLLGDRVRDRLRNVRTGLQSILQLLSKDGVRPRELQLVAPTGAEEDSGEVGQERNRLVGTNL